MGTISPMDTLTHALTGALAARCIAARRDAPPALAVGQQGSWDAPWRPGPRAPQPWQCVVVGLVAGAFPDIDVVARLVSDLAYLRHHRGITHSLLLAPAWAALLAAAFGQVFASTRGLRGAWKSWYVVTLAALLAHIAGDWITSFGTMLLAPLSDHRFALGSTFIIDLVLSGLAVLGLVLAVLWPRRRWPAAVAALSIVGWVGVSWLGQQEAMAVAEARARALGIQQPVIHAMPRPASPFNWTLAVWDGHSYQLAHINTRRTQALVTRDDDSFIRQFSAPYAPVAEARWQHIPRFGSEAAESDFARRAFEHPSFGFYRWFAEVPALERIEARRSPDGEAQRCAWFQDLRFGFPGRDDTPFRYALCLSEGAPGTAETVEVLTRDRDSGEVLRVAASAWPGAVIERR
jgi:inner membrane protein